MTNQRTAYPSDVDDNGWKMIEALLPKPQGRGRPREYALREIVNGIFYVVRGGIAWRMMPHDLPPWRLVYIYFWKWSKAKIWEKINALFVERVRVKAGREAQPSLGVIDSQSVKTANGGEARGIDGNKKIHGRKRHVVSDTQGNILAAEITAANVSDSVGGQKVLQNLHDQLTDKPSHRLVKLLADSAYLSIVAVVLALFGWVIEVVQRPANIKGFVVQKTRWVIERTHAWQGRYRRLSKDYECTTRASQAMVYLASIHRSIRRLRPVV